MNPHTSRNTLRGMDYTGIVGSPSKPQSSAAKNNKTELKLTDLAPGMVYQIDAPGHHYHERYIARGTKDASIVTSINGHSLNVPTTLEILNEIGCKITPMPLMKPLLHISSSKPKPSGLQPS